MEKIDNKQLLNIVSFCILMENDEGILTKSPGYIKEKFITCIRYGYDYERQDTYGLDYMNYKKLKNWAKKWLDIDIK